MPVSQHIISILVENKFGVLSRVAGLFSGRGFNIESLSVGASVEHSTSQITIVTKGDERIIEQITKQLNKLVDVIKVVDLADKDYIVRETALIKIHTTRAEDRSEALRITEIFRARVVDSTPVTYTVEITGDENKIDAIINLLRPLGIKEIVRTGKIAIAREDVKVPALLEVKRVRA
ncbi:MAG: acetolactate synthase small subunit [Nitrospirae bacterium]|nr:acetolactate synthase small subunit [Nitrospirota bacterium]